MTEKKQSSKQNEIHNRHANYRVGLSVYRPDRKEHAPAAKNRGEQLAPRTLQRVVSVPDDSPAEAWQVFAQRQDSLRRARARARTAHPHPQSVPRTLAQTGVRATAGRMQTVRRPLPYQASPIPRRSSRRQPRRNILMRLLACFILLVLLLGSLTFFFAGNASNILPVQQVEVMGSHNAALVQSFQGMHIRGQDILFLSSAVLQRRILAMPSVAAVSIQKQLPDQVMISLVERQPVLLWQATNGTFGVDRTGKVIAAVDRSSNMEHLQAVFDVTSRGRSSVGAPANPPPLAVGASLAQANILFALSVLQQVPRMDHIDAFTLYYDGTMFAGINDQATMSQGAYILQSSQGWKAYLGNAFSANSLQNRLLELQAILTLAQQQRLAFSTIDLRYGLHPAITLR